jgi:hypothetical protein
LVYRSNPLAVLLCLLLVPASPSPARQQPPPASIHILLLNGNDGKPLTIGNTGQRGGPLSLTVFANCDRGYPCLFPGRQYMWTIDSTGHADIPNIPNLRTIEVGRPTDWLKYCQDIPLKPGQLGGQPTFPVADILRTGLVAPNTCNPRLKLRPQPGQLIFFLRPLTLWESLSKDPQM